MTVVTPGLARHTTIINGANTVPAVHSTITSYLKPASECSWKLRTNLGKFNSMHLLLQDGMLLLPWFHTAHVECHIAGQKPHSQENLCTVHFIGQLGNKYPTLVV